jgi:hypothetical protein
MQTFSIFFISRKIESSGHIGGGLLLAIATAADAPPLPAWRRGFVSDGLVLLAVEDHHV